jgi:hypothetical protein
MDAFTYITVSSVLRLPVWYSVCQRLWRFMDIYPIALIQLSNLRFARVQPNPQPRFRKLVQAQSQFGHDAEGASTASFEGPK